MPVDGCVCVWTGSSHVCLVEVAYTYNSGGGGVLWITVLWRRGVFGIGRVGHDTIHACMHGTADD